jgi:2-oxo-3-hexenedioate decarboxylase
MSAGAAHAQAILAALDARRAIPPITEADPEFGLDAAYGVSGAVMAARIARGEKPAGWKIGFTNRTIWDEYGVHAPIWGPVYAHTLHHTDGENAATLDAAAFVEPRIEPEIVFRIARAPDPGMDERELLGCIDAVGHGFEIVQSLYPGWRFRAADTVAAFALHGALVCGPMARIDVPDDWLGPLADFSIELARDGKPVDRGVAENVLGGPLRHCATSSPGWRRGRWRAASSRATSSPPAPSPAPSPCAPAKPGPRRFTAFPCPA